MDTNEVSLFCEFQFKGIWWLPNQPEARRFGVLSWNGEQLILELFNTSSTPDRAQLGIFDKDAVILGQLEDGQPCTLLGIYETSRLNQQRIPEAIFHADSAFIGSHFPSSEAICFRSVTVEFTHLAEWMFNESLFQQTDIHEAGRFQGWRVDFRMQNGSNINVPEIDATIGFGYTASTSSRFTTIKLNVTPCISISPSTEQRFEWYLKIIRDIQNWLTLLIGRLVQLTHIYAITQQVQVWTEQFEDQRVQVIKSRMGKRREESTHPIQIRVALHSIKDEIEELLQNWFKRSEQIRDVINLFFGTIYAGELYVEFHFLSLIQAVETFSRATTDSEYLPPEKYSDIQKSLIDAIPEYTPTDLKVSLTNRLKYANEFSLRKRLKALLISLNPKTIALVCVNRNQYVERVVSTRNYLTHYTSELKAEAWHQDKMFNACQSLNVLLTILLFKDIGLTEERIRDMLNTHYSTSRAISIYLKNL